MRKAGSILLTTTLILLSLLSLLSYTTSAGPTTQVILSPEYQETEVAVDPESDGTTLVQVNVTVRTESPLTLTVDLYVEWPQASVSITPSSLTFNTVGFETKEVSVQIQVPLLTSSSSDISCLIEGLWYQGAFSGSVYPATINVKVLPFYECNIFSDEPEKSVIQGGSTDFNFTIENKGNCDDIYHLEILNMEKLKSHGILVQGIREIAIEEQSVVEIYVDVSTSSNTPSQKHAIHIVITSSKSESDPHGLVKEEYMIVINVQGSPEFAIFSDPLVFISMLGVSLVIILIIAVVIVGIMIYRRKGRAVIVVEPS
ncbi:MAG: hypothetical protein JSW00_17485 [Thermoplasmata archaeon]|nr:MAG: hypothetical protein JSW00_17485 [Thermoplasmata archaeon]